MYSIETASKLLGVCPQTIFRWLSEGRLVRTKVLGNTRIRQSELQKLIVDGARDEAKAARCREVGLANRVLA